LGDNMLLDAEGYKQRMKLGIGPILLESDRRAQERGVTAYIVAAPFGWPIDRERSEGTAPQDDALFMATCQLQIEAYKEIMKDASLAYVQDLCLVDYPNDLPEEVHRIGLLSCVAPDKFQPEIQLLPGHAPRHAAFQVLRHYHELNVLWLDLSEWDKKGAPEGGFTQAELSRQCGNLQVFSKPSFALGYLKRIKVKRDQQQYQKATCQVTDLLNPVNGDEPSSIIPPDWICVISQGAEQRSTNGYGGSQDTVIAFMQQMLSEGMEALVQATVVCTPDSNASSQYKRWFHQHPLVSQVCCGWDELVQSLEVLRGEKTSGGDFDMEDAAGHSVRVHFWPSGGPRSKAPNTRLAGLDAAKLLVRCYDSAEGGCAVAGNEYWLGRPSATLGASLAAASTLGEVHNPLVNPALAGAPYCILPAPDGLT
jgi:hypothetical protein